MTIFLHIGTHKTGTTAVQHHLRRHSAFYASQGLWYPKESELLSRGRDLATHLHVARSLDTSSRSKTYNTSQLQEIADSLISKARDYRHTIFSAEAFWRIGFGCVENDSDPNERWRRKAENIHSIRKLFGSGADIRVVCVIRERISYIQRHYSELILATSYRKSIHRFLKTYGHLADYQRQISAWDKHFPVLTLSYEKLCEQGNLTAHFLNSLTTKIRHPPNTDSQKAQVNIGHPIPCVFYKRYLNGIEGMPRDQALRIYKKAKRKFAKIKSTSRAAPLKLINSWLTAKEIRNLRQGFLADDDQIRRSYCSELVSAPPTSGQDQNSFIHPLTKENQDLVLGWMFSKQQPAATWFQPSPRP